MERNIDKTIPQLIDEITSKYPFRISDDNISEDDENGNGDVDKKVITEVRK